MSSEVTVEHLLMTFFHFRNYILLYNTYSYFVINTFFSYSWSYLLLCYNHIATPNLRKYLMYFAMTV